MILQSLVDYYKRAQLATPGWELKAISFFIVLDHDGKVVSVESRIEEKNPRGEQILVPQSEIRSGKNAWAQPNLLWDHHGFLLGEPKRKSNGEIDPADSYAKAEKQRGAFVARIKQLKLRHPESKGLASISKFYETGEFKKVFSRTDAAEMASIPGGNITFRLVDAIEPVLHEKWVQDIVSTKSVDATDSDEIGTSKFATCLATGEFEEIARLHPKIYRVCSKPTAFAAANSKEAPAYSSYGKDQGFIFPVGKSAAFAYTTALNHLLRKGSPQRMQVGDASTVCWADHASPFETAFSELFGQDAPGNPDDGTPAVQALFNAIHSGRFAQPEGDNRFHVLGLSPNAARISVRFYHCLPLRDMAGRIAQHFADVDLVPGPYDPQYPSLKHLLQAVCLPTKTQPFGDLDRLPPNLGGAVIDAILAGPNVPYPAQWLNAAVGRFRVPQKTDESKTVFLKNQRLRAAVIKACLNRSIRFRHSPEKEFLPMLDPENQHPAYRLGRLFAVLEKIQEEASPGLNATIRDRYYGAASSTPVAVFTTLLRLKNAHLKKLVAGRAVWFEKLLGEVLAPVQDFPLQLPLPDQGRFALGYYHQRQDFFTRKSQDAAPNELQGELV